MSSGARSEAGLLLDVSRHLFMGGPPDIARPLDVRDQLLQDDDAGAMANDVGCVVRRNVVPSSYALSNSSI